MKKILITFFVFIFSASLFAADELPLAKIKVSPEWGKTQCASKPGSGISLVWNGVTDKRSNPDVGSLKKGGEELAVKLADPVDDVVGSALKTAFTNCGFNVETKKGATGVSVAVDLDELFAGSKKGFFTGETDARGSITLHFSNGGNSYDYTLGATKSDKRLRKKNIKQLEEVLTGLLESVVVQVGDSPSLISELKKLSQKGE